MLRYVPVASVILCGLAGCNHESRLETTLTPVATRPVELRNQSDELRYSANVEPDLRVDLAFRVGGYVESIRQARGADGRERPLQEGDLVTRGTVLVVLRRQDYTNKVNQGRAQLSQARSALEAAKAQLVEAQAGARKAEQDFTRAHNLLESQSLTRSDYDSAKARLDASRGQVDAAKGQADAAESAIKQAQAGLADADLAFQDSELKAPINGVILKRLVEVGTLVGPGTPAFSLADTSTMKVLFGAPDTVVPMLRLGSIMPVRTESVPDAVFPGRITAIAPSADPKSRVFEVQVSVPNAANRLKAGMIATVVVGERAATKAIPVLPLSAVLRSRSKPDGYAVFVVQEEDGKRVARLRDVELGEAFGNAIAVTAGVNLGQRVVTDGSNLVRDGEAVQVVP